MIIHVVLFQPHTDLDASARDELMTRLRSAATSIPTIRRFRVGPRTRHGLPGYEQAMIESYDYAVIAEFDDRAGLITYLQHPAHHEIGRHFTVSAERSLAYDYEMEDVGTRQD
jgi:Stress responsive A/B Barrel Domain